MASEVQIGGSELDRVFLGTDFIRDFHVLDIDTDPTGATAKNIAGKTIVLDIRKQDKSPTPAKYTQTLSIIGSFNSVAASNTQRARWLCLDTDLTTAIFGVGGGTFRYSVKVTDDGSETVLQWGPIVIDRATQT